MLYLKNQHTSLRTAHMCVHIVAYSCHIQHNTEQFW